MTDSGTQPTWTDVATAIGTIGAVVVSLLLAGTNTRRERAAVTRSRVLELLDDLGEISRLLPRIQHPGLVMMSSTSQQMREVMDLHDRVARAERATLPLLDPRLQQRWSAMRLILMDLYAAAPIPDNVPENPLDWTKAKLGRARQHVDAYLDYLRSSLLAAFDGRPLPCDQAPPFLRRDDPIVWSPRKEPPPPDWGPRGRWSVQGFDV